MRRNSRKIRLPWIALLIAGALTCGGVVSDAAQPAATTQPLSAGSIIKDLTAVVQWYENVWKFTQTPASVDEAIYRDGIRGSAGETTRLAFDLARAEAQILASTPGGAVKPGANSKAQSAANQAAETSRRIDDVDTQLKEINQQLVHGPTTQPVDLLSAEEAKLNAEKNLLEERRDVMLNYASMMAGPQGGEATEVLQKIDELERSVPDLPPSPGSPSPAASTPSSGSTASADNSKPANDNSGVGPMSLLPGMSSPVGGGDSSSSSSSSSPPSSSSAGLPPFRPETAGIFSLVSELFTISGKMSQIKDLEAQTNGPNNSSSIEKILKEQHDPIVEQLKAAVQQSEVLAGEAPTTNVAKLKSETSQLQQLNDRYHLLVAAAFPLSQQTSNIAVISARLHAWHDSLSSLYMSTLWYLLGRLAAMMGGILIVLLVGKLWRRAAFRYVTEPRRRRVILLVQRVVTATLIVIIMLLTFVTEFGSLATFAGIITAGIAVALQSIILAGVAYFFVVGRYGIRIGDRVTVNGITGDVVDTGLFRFYLMELSGTGWDLHPTGRVVVFSNAVLFQAAAFYKQLPGAEFTWHEVAMTLSPESDYKLAQELLLKTVVSVYESYKDRIVEQHRVAASQVHVPMDEPRPQGRLRFVDAGLEFLVRYPVEITDASEIDDQVTRALLTQIESEPKLKLVVSGTPKIQRAG